VRPSRKQSSRKVLPGSVEGGNAFNPRLLGQFGALARQLVVGGELPFCRAHSLMGGLAMKPRFFSLRARPYACRYGHLANAGPQES
jgi:hypothetical protein